MISGSADNCRRIEGAIWPDEWGRSHYVQYAAAGGYCHSTGCQLFTATSCTASLHPDYGNSLTTFSTRKKHAVGSGLRLPLSCAVASLACPPRYQLRAGRGALTL